MTPTANNSRTRTLGPHRWRGAPLADVLGRGARDGAVLLGDDNPLVRTLDLLAVVVRQALPVAVVLVLAIVGVVRHIPWAPSLLVAAALVEFALIAAIGLLVQLGRGRARELIIEGLEGLHLPCVAAECERLLDPRKQRRLARALEQIVRAAENYDRLLIASRPPPGTRRLREIAPELRDIAARVGAGEVDMRGVARLEQLLTGGYASPFYTGRIKEVQLELERIRSGSPGDERSQRLS